MIDILMNIISLNILQVMSPVSILANTTMTMLNTTINLSFLLTRKDISTNAPMSEKGGEMNWVKTKAIETLRPINL